MDETNAKHRISVSIDGYVFYVNSYKISRSSEIKEIPAFSTAKASAYMGYGHERLEVKAFMDRSRLNELYFIINGFKGSGEHTVEIDGLSVGNFMLVGYEYCGNEDKYIYDVSLSLYKNA